ncbi:MAG: flagellar biosynthetic protein FliO [Gammaproteobacteria bacterium]|nr:flagellar biosynthetic protein FliO [Gammaproteobacteria bacterium]
MKQAGNYALWTVILVVGLGGAAESIGDTNSGAARQNTVTIAGGSQTNDSQTGHSQKSDSAAVTANTVTPTSSPTSSPGPSSTSSPRSIKSNKPSPGEFPIMSQPDVGTGVIQVTFGLFVVLLIIAAAAWFTRRFGHFQATAGGALKVVGGLHLGAKERLVVVQVGDQQLLLGVAPGRVSTLHVLSNPLDQGDINTKRSPAIAGSFRDKLNAVLKREGQ